MKPPVKRPMWEAKSVQARRRKNSEHESESRGQSHRQKAQQHLQERIGQDAMFDVGVNDGRWRWQLVRFSFAVGGQLLLRSRIQEPQCRSRQQKLTRGLWDSRGARHSGQGLNGRYRQMRCCVANTGPNRRIVKSSESKKWLVSAAVLISRCNTPSKLRGCCFFRHFATPAASINMPKAASTRLKKRCPRSRASRVSGSRLGCGLVGDATRIATRLL